MFSPYKLTGIDSNYLYINSNFDLANRLEDFFKRDDTQFLWNLNTNRQRVTAALRHTSMVSIRQLIPPSEMPKNTAEWNEVLSVANTKIYEGYPIFQRMVEWLENSLKAAGAEKVEFGRIFFSKHSANTEIDLHTDQGTYFSYYDRFHYVIDQVDNDNIFYIREEPVILEKGKLYWVNNHVPHWLANRSDRPRINLIFDARLS